MANKTLAEVKTVLNTEKVFETATAFGVNAFGKYLPNITFIIQKEFERSPLDYRLDVIAREMVAGMNLDVNGEVAVLFGDFWVSGKGGACFRPKSIVEAQHVLIRVGWGGAFDTSRGVRGNVDEAVYYRRAASNGGGVGNDYLVVPVGFFRVVRDAEIDGDIPSTAPDFAARAKEVREKFSRFDREQSEKSAVEAQTKAEAEAASRSAKELGFGARIEAMNSRLENLGRELVELGDTSFKWGWQHQLYTEENVAHVERHVAQLETERTKKECQCLTREAFQPKFEAFQARITALGLTLEFTEESVRISGDYYGNGQPYSEEGVAKFASDLDRRERTAAEVKAKAEAEAEYQRRKNEAVSLGLPTDVRIWCRRGGRTNAGDGWVIGPDGQDRGNTAWHNPRPRHTSEGDKIWEQILSGEIVLQWSKSCSAAEHEFAVVHLPSTSLTEAQLERIAEIELELEREWENARGLASGLPSPSVGNGWGLCKKQFAPKPPAPTPIATLTLSGSNKCEPLGTLADALRKAGLHQ